MAELTDIGRRNLMAQFRKLLRQKAEEAAQTGRWEPLSDHFTPWVVVDMLNRIDELEATSAESGAEEQ